MGFSDLVCLMAKSVQVKIWRPSVAAILLVQPILLGAYTAPKDSPSMKMLACDACGTIMVRMRDDMKYLFETNQMWKPKDLAERVQISCGDPLLPSGAMRDACGYMMADYHKAIAREVAKYWDEDAEEFEEDIMPIEFCSKLGICKEDHKGINQMLGESDRKEKDLKWQEKYDATMKKGKKKLVELDDEDEEE